MQKYKVVDMNCGHCEARIKKALGEQKLENSIDLEAKEVTITSDVKSDDVIKIIKDAGYSATLI